MMWRQEPQGEHCVIRRQRLVMRQQARLYRGSLATPEAKRKIQNTGSLGAIENMAPPVPTILPPFSCEVITQSLPSCHFGSQSGLCKPWLSSCHTFPHIAFRINPYFLPSARSSWSVPLTRPGTDFWPCNSLPNHPRFPLTPLQPLGLCAFNSPSLEHSAFPTPFFWLMLFVLGLDISSQEAFFLSLS